MAIGALKSKDDASAKKLFQQAKRNFQKAEKKEGGLGPPTRREGDHIRTGRLPFSEERETLAAFTLDLGAREEAVLLSGHIKPSIHVDDLKFIELNDPSMLSVRWAGKGEGWTAMPISVPAQRDRHMRSWDYGIPAGDGTVVLEWKEGIAPARDEFINLVYDQRVNALSVKDLGWRTVDSSGTAAYLLHIYAYVLPVAIADCFHELGEYKKAEEYYITATKYKYINKNIEGVVLWTKLAQNILSWGDNRYLAEEFDEAREQYGKLLTAGLTTPAASFMYTTDSLSVAAAEAENLIDHLQEDARPEINPLIAEPIYTVASRWVQLNANLDFFGLTLFPIHTFEYLRQVAIGFAKEAIQAEREFINFESRAEMEEATRRELEQAVAMTQYETDAREALYLAARDDQSAAGAARQLAQERHTNAIQERQDYIGVGYTQAWAQAAAAALGGGEDAMYGDISDLADRLDRGETISGPGPQLAAAQLLLAGRKNVEYELSRMQNDIDELNIAIGIADSQQQAAVHRSDAAFYGWLAAITRKAMAQDALEAFDKEFFTPDTWHVMAQIMRTIARNHLYRAIRVAKLMERSYHFETDVNLKIIKNVYGFAQAQGLLGADALIADIEAFTFHSITHQRQKETEVKDVVSLALDFPRQFELFKETGYLEFETSLNDFDLMHPGFYSQRIKSVEVEIVGFVPPDGLNGTLTAGGVSRYRTAAADSKTRLHVKDIMALSGFTLRNDAFVFGADNRIRGLFEGLGLGTTWILNLPKRSNNFDYRRIFDIRLVLYYRSKYDPQLQETILTRAPLPGELVRVKDFALRYDFPEAWYVFYENAQAQFTMSKFNLPLNQRNFDLQHLYLRVETEEGVSNENLELEITVPGKLSVTVTTDSNGAVSSRDITELADVMAGDVLGDWSIRVTGGASVTEEGSIVTERIVGMRLGVEYGFEWID
jgi:hypothetical protein